MVSGHHPPLTAGNHFPLLFLLLLLFTGYTYTSAQSPPSSNGGNNNNNPYFASTSFSPSMAIVIVVLISAFFFLGFFSIYIRQCSGDGSSSTSVRLANAAAANARSRRQRGLTVEVLDSFPTFLYSEVKERKIGKGSLECAVCLSEFEDDETLRLLPKCSHVFHHDCIDAWLAAHVTCPVCRSNLLPDPNDPDPDEIRAPDQQEPPSSDLNQDHVSVEVDHVGEEEDDHHHQAMEDLERFVNMKRAKSRATALARFPRSHSTGHSLVPPGENLDRFTLRLPEDVRREIVEAARKFQRTRSLLVFNTEESSRRGYRGGGEGSVGRAGPGRMSRSDRWGSFLMRTWGRRGGGDGEGSNSNRGGSSRGGFFRMGRETGEAGEPGSAKGGKLNGVRGTFDCYGGVRKVDDGKEDESSTAALNRV